MSQEAKWADGQSVLSQERPYSYVEWGWVDGQTGKIPVSEYTGSEYPTGALPTFIHV